MRNSRLPPTRFSLTVAPARGGALIELAWRPTKLNLLNTLARRFEAYHMPTKKPAHHEGRDLPSIHDLAKSIDSVAGELVYDDHPRYSFLEHLIPSSFDETALMPRIHKRASFAGAHFTVMLDEEAAVYRHVLPLKSPRIPRLPGADECHQVSRELKRHRGRL